MKNSFYKYAFIAFLLFAAALLAFGLTGCRTIKKSTVTRDSVVKVDSSATVNKSLTVQIDTTNTKVNTSTDTKIETTIEDTAIGFGKKKLSFKIGKNVRVDTIIEDGIFWLDIRTDIEGNIRVDANLDSITVIFQKMRRIKETTTRNYDSVVVVNKSLVQKLDSISSVKHVEKASHSQETVKEKSLSWFGRFMANLKWYLIIVVVGVCCFFAGKWFG